MLDLVQSDARSVRAAEVGEETRAEDVLAFRWVSPVEYSSAF
ncbi:hypothetical protein H4W33_004659 [Kibdelosporangium phytohabitans]|nr:hypothetical protein [Kibdelosporangium phytohabitans]